MAESDDLSALDYPNCTDYVLANVDNYADKLCFIEDSTGRQLTFSEFRSHVRKLAAHLWHRGWRTGDVVVFFANSMLEFPIAYHAACIIGVNIHPVNYTFTKEELLRCVIAVNGKFIFTSSDTMERALAANEDYRKQGKRIRDFVVLDKVPGFADVMGLLQKDFNPPFPEVTFDPKVHPLCIFTTSGTTGPPKMAARSHYSLMATSESIGDMGMGTSFMEDDLVLMTVPYFAGQTIICMLSHSLRFGLPTVIPPKFELESFLQVIEKYKVTIVHTIPGTVNAMTKTPLLEKYDTSSIKEITCSGSKISPKTIGLLEERLPKMTFRQAYGSTEAGLIAFPAPHLNHLGCVGTLPKLCSLKIVDIDTRKELVPNETGEILVKGPQLFTEYLNNPEATADNMEDGWNKTGDVGYLDKSGGLYIVDRIKDVIKVGTYQVSPTELESDVMTHSDVFDAAVIGIPRDDDLGEHPKAFVIRKPGSNVTADDIVQYIKERVSPLRYLTGGVEFVDSIPRNTVGKVMRRTLREKVLDKKTW